jgi:5-methylthioribose kinase
VNPEQIRPGSTGMLDEDELQALMVRVGLLATDQPIRVEELTGGVSSTILKIETQSGTYCLKQALPVLKVAQVWTAPVDRVYAEIAWLQLAEKIVPGCVPQVLGIDRPTHSFVMSFLPPATFPNWKAELLAGRIDPSFAAKVGATLVRIHGATARQEAVRRKFANDDDFLALRLDPYLLETARRHTDLATNLRNLVARTQAQRLALVHGDISPKNILIGPSGPIFLDAECAWYGDPAFDVAFCLNHLLLKSAADRNNAALFLESFDMLADAYLSGVNWEPRESIEVRIASLLPALALARISGKSPVEYLNPAARQLVVEVVKPLIAHPPMNLKDLKYAWKRGFAFE